jgi:SAM-dependent methyltransferase
VANDNERQRWNDGRWTETWMAREQLTAVVTSDLLNALELQSGERVVDIGCGGGEQSIAAARRVEPGPVLGVDLSTALTSIARERALQAVVGNVSFAVADAQTDELGAFDVAMSQFGVMFFDAPLTAFANIRASLVVGGRLGFACWQELARNPWHTAPALRPFVPPPPPGGPGPFSLGDRAATESMLAAAGFVDVASVDHVREVETPTAALFDPRQLEVAGIAAERIAEARDAVVAHLAPFSSGAGLYRFPIAFRVVTCRTP